MEVQGALLEIRHLAVRNARMVDEFAAGESGAGGGLVAQAGGETLPEVACAIVEEDGACVDEHPRLGGRARRRLQEHAPGAFLVFRCKPSGGTRRTSSESTAVTWLTPDEVAERMAEVFAIRLLDAMDGDGPMCGATTVGASFLSSLS